MPARKTATKPAKSKAKPAAKKRAPARKASGAPDVPSLFRLNVEVGDLAAAADFYGRLFGLPSRPQAGSRFYLRCGPATLQVVDVSSEGPPHPAAKALYFTVRDLEAIFDRARALDCLSAEDVHGAPAGAMAVRPWGERSFYALDPWGNPLCFVELGTTYAG